MYKKHSKDILTTIGNIYTCQTHSYPSRMLTSKYVVKNNNLVSCFFSVQKVCKFVLGIRLKFELKTLFDVLGCRLVRYIEKSMKSLGKPTNWKMEFSG